LEEKTKNESSKKVKKNRSKKPKKRPANAGPGQQIVSFLEKSEKGQKKKNCIFLNQAYFIW